MNKKRILIAENDPEAQVTQVEYWQRQGYEVLAADSPEDAISMLAQKPDIVISDLRLRNDADEKDTSGLKVIRAAQAADIPAILTTNSARSFPDVIVIPKSQHDALLTKVRELIG